MTWTKLSDDFTDDCWELSDAAHRLHVEALVWSNRKLLDCRISKKDMARWAKHTERECICELLDCGWWEDDGDAYLIHHHSTYQRTREQVLRQQDANRAAGKRSGRERARRRGNVVNESLNDSLNDSRNERDGTGLVSKGNQKQARTRKKPGTSLSNGQPKKNHSEVDNDTAEEDYAADLREWCEEQP